MLKSRALSTAWYNAGRDLAVVGVGEQRNMLFRAVERRQPAPLPGRQFARPEYNTFQDLGGRFIDAPAVVYPGWGDMRLDFFGIGTDRALYHRVWDAGRLYPANGWEPLGGEWLTPVAVVAPGLPGATNQRLDVFGVAADRTMRHIAFYDGGWHEEDLGGQFTSAPAAVLTAIPFQLDICGVGDDLSLWHKAWRQDRWDPPADGWTGLGGSFASHATLCGALDDVHFLGIGWDDALYRRTYTGGRQGTASQYFPYQDWCWHGYGFTSPAAAAVRNDVFGVGEDDAMWRVQWPGEQNPVLGSRGEAGQVGGQFLSAPSVSAAVAGGDDMVDVVGLGLDRQVWHRSWRNGSVVTNWHQLNDDRFWVPDQRLAPREKRGSGPPAPAPAPGATFSLENGAPADLRIRSVTWGLWRATGAGYAPVDSRDGTTVTFTPPAAGQYAVIARVVVANARSGQDYELADFRGSVTVNGAHAQPFVWQGTPLQFRFEVINQTSSADPNLSGAVVILIS